MKMTQRRGTRCQRVIGVTKMPDKKWKSSSISSGPALFLTRRLLEGRRCAAPTDALQLTDTKGTGEIYYFK